MAKQTWAKDNGQWRKVKSAWINVGGTWKKDVMPKGVVKGDWKEFMSYYEPIIFYTDRDDEKIRALNENGECLFELEAPRIGMLGDYFYPKVVAHQDNKIYVGFYDTQSRNVDLDTLEEMSDSLGLLAIDTLGNQYCMSRDWADYPRVVKKSKNKTIYDTRLPGDSIESYHKANNLCVTDSQNRGYFRSYTSGPQITALDDDGEQRWNVGGLWTLSPYADTFLLYNKFSNRIIWPVYNEDDQIGGMYIISTNGDKTLRKAYSNRSPSDGAIDEKGDMYFVDYDYIYKTDRTGFVKWRKSNPDRLNHICYTKDGFIYLGKNDTIVKLNSENGDMVFTKKGYGNIDSMYAI